MLTALIPALIMAFVSSLAFIAYKHPKAYARMHLPLMIIVGSFSLFFFAYYLGHIQGFSDSTIAYLKLNSGLELKSPKYSTLSIWVLLLPGAVLGYLNMLYFLPNILGLKTKNLKEDFPKHDLKDKYSKDT